MEEGDRTEIVPGFFSHSVPHIGRRPDDLHPATAIGQTVVPVGVGIDPSCQFEGFLGSEVAGNHFQCLESSFGCPPGNTVGGIGGGGGPGDTRPSPRLRRRTDRPLGHVHRLESLDQLAKPEGVGQRDNCHADPEPLRPTARRSPAHGSPGYLSPENVPSCPEAVFSVRSPLTMGSTGPVGHRMKREEPAGEPGYQRSAVAGGVLGQDIRSTLRFGGGLPLRPG